ncbi:MAG: hypothetical protein M0C28_15005 [Candidatus Moduliflexus flocculans]|nr:hypothetical protein [Candidatus Moduliflexus flocculans]
MRGHDAPIPFPDRRSRLRPGRRRPGPRPDPRREREPGLRGFEGNGGRPAEEAPGREFDEVLVGRALEMGRPLLVRDLLTDPLFADLELDGDGRRRAASWPIPGPSAAGPPVSPCSPATPPARPFDREPHGVPGPGHGARPLPPAAERERRPGDGDAAASGSPVRRRAVHGRGGVGPPRPGHDREGPRRGGARVHLRRERHGQGARRQDHP